MVESPREELFFSKKNIHKSALPYLLIPHHLLLGGLAMSNLLGDINNGKRAAFLPSVFFDGLMNITSHS
jgi:hypothetical protein